MYYGTQLLKDAGFSDNAAPIANIANGVTAVIGGAWGIKVMFLLLFLIGLVLIWFVRGFLPNTSGRSLEDLEEHFSRGDYLIKDRATPAAHGEAAH